MRRRSTNGFTLIELIISVAIIATLAAGAASLLENSIQRAKEYQLRADLREIRQAIDAYKRAYDQGLIVQTVDATGYPPSLDVLVKGVADAKSPKRVKIYFLRRIPTDPMAQNQSEGSDSWGLRSYASDPDDPQPGRDVFDVYSQSKRNGLNGSAYSRW